MPSRLSDLEAQRRDERRAAKRWWARNQGRLPQLPQQERVVSPSGLTARLILGLASDEAKLEHGVVYDERHRFVPLQGFDTELDLDSAHTAALVERAMGTLPVSQQNLLNRHYLEGRPLSDLRRKRESRQAVHQRLQRAADALLRAIVDRADEPVELTVEDF